MPNETFYAPGDLGQACSLLSDLGDKAVVIAGGTDLMPRFNRYRRRRTEVLIYVGKLGLDFIEEKDGRLVIGAAATLSDILASPMVKEKVPLLARACGEIASPAVRNAATLGGNVMTNARSADGVAALMALGATVVTASNSGESRMPIDRFVWAPRKEKIANGGIVKQFEIPCLTGADRWVWEKLKQRQGDGRSVVSVSLRAGMEGNICRSIRLVLGAMAAHPFVSNVEDRGSTPGRKSAFPGPYRPGGGRDPRGNRRRHRHPGHRLVQATGRPGVGKARSCPTFMMET
ncbi:MAG: FAD binding domain-containing protein [Gammaproteobacteria bacterium]